MGGIIDRAGVFKMKGMRIKKLFGRFDYMIELADNGMTILTGPNGFGKSTILHIIDAMSNSDLAYFVDLFFEEIEFLMKEEQNFVIRKEKDVLVIDGQEISKYDIVEWRKYGIKANADVLGGELPYQLIGNIICTMKNVVGEIYFIEEQRLVRYQRYARIVDGRRVAEQKIVHIVEQIPNKILKEMGRVANEYSKVANELDSSFPQRLFAETSGISKEAFDEKLSDMKEKVGKLSKFGISNIGELGDIQFKKEDARTLKVYFEDFEEKFNKYAKLVEQLELFTDIVNRRFLFKQVIISIEDGICIVDDETRRIPLSRLSSGEKEILVLFYQLIFEVPEGVLLLIDEPEISLHIAWQRMFVNDIGTIIDKKNITALIATHSVQIVTGNQAIQIDLGKQYGKKGFDKG